MKNYTLVKQDGSFVIYRRVETDLPKIIKKYSLADLVQIINPEDYKIEYVIKGNFIRELKQFDNFTISGNLIIGDNEKPDRFTPILYFTGEYTTKVNRIEAYLLVIVWQTQKLKYVNKFHSLKL